MLQNVYFLAKIGADTAENEQNFAEIWPTGDEFHAEPVGTASTSSWTAPGGSSAPKGTWAANKRFEVLKVKFKFPRARTFELYRAHSAVSKPNFASK